ncbi:hypothetical protein [Novosphingobium sp. CCH12-A3]|uniref:hypothetical protein n=1 Tax=Novosphingobium sp. CCH12-A3 TaxID=1768752 RepID=UPI000781CB09|nr:hypothetical protein [Novosphingobium sp. CCH12-A3]
MTDPQPASDPREPAPRDPAQGTSHVGRYALIAAGLIALGAGSVAMLRGPCHRPPPPASSLRWMT